MEFKNAHFLADFILAFAAFSLVWTVETPVEEFVFLELETLPAEPEEKELTVTVVQA